MTTDADSRGASDLCDQLGPAPKRPDCWEFAMEFLGPPEDAEVQRYVETLEAWAVAAVAAERERCAKLCDAKSESTDCSEESLQTWIDAAELIRRA